MIPRIAVLSAICAALVWAQAPPPAPAQIAVSGDIAAPLTLTADDLAKMPRETVTIPDRTGPKWLMRASRCARF